MSGRAWAGGRGRVCGCAGGGCRGEDTGTDNREGGVGGAGTGIGIGLWCASEDGHSDGDEDEDLADHAALDPAAVPDVRHDALLDGFAGRRDREREAGELGDAERGLERRHPAVILVEVEEDVAAGVLERTGGGDIRPQNRRR